MTQNLPAVVTMGELEKMATAIVKSNLFGVKTVDQAVTLMLVAQAEGLHPATAARDYHVIQGRPALKADAMLARFQQAGGKVEWESYTDAKVSGNFSHPQSPKPVLIEWTLDMAKRIGLAGKDNWKNYPRAMLRARVISEGVRTCYPAIASGIYTPEEVGDFAEKDITPTAGSMQLVKIDRQEVIMETAVAVKGLLANDQAQDAYAMWQNSGFDNDEKAAFWSQLDSKQKGVLGRMAEAEKAHQTGTISEPQKKRLEARIKSEGLDRDEVKAYCLKEFGVNHFQELTREQYEALDKELGTINAVPQDDKALNADKLGTADAGNGSQLNPAGAAPKHITEAQEGELLDLLEANGISIKTFLQFGKLKRIADLPAERIQGAKDWIAKNKVAK